MKFPLHAAVLICMLAACDPESSQMDDLLQRADQGEAAAQYRLSVIYATGEVLWQGPGRMGHNATLLVVGGNLLTLTSDAALIVTELGADQYEAIRSYDVADSETYGHPAPVGDNSLLIKDDHSLTLWSWE